MDKELFGEESESDSECQPLVHQGRRKRPSFTRPVDPSEPKLKKRRKSSINPESNLDDSNLEIPDSDEEFGDDDPLLPSANETCPEVSDPVPNDLEEDEDDDEFLDLLDGLQDDDEEEEEQEAPAVAAAAVAMPNTPAKSQSQYSQNDGKKKKKYKDQVQRLNSALKHGREQEKREKKRQQTDFETHSGIRMQSRVMDQSALDTRLRRIEVIKLKDLHTRHKRKLVPNAFAVIGVIGSKLCKTSAKSGNKFLIIRLTDLNHCELACFVFNDEARMKYSGMADGTVVALGGAKIMDKNNAQDMALQITTKDQMLPIGHALDYGKCKAMKRDNTPCTAVVNTNYVLYCPFHSKKKYEKAVSKRAGLNNQKVGKNHHGFGNTRYQKISQGGFMYKGQRVTADAEVARKKKRRANKCQIIQTNMNKYQNNPRAMGMLMSTKNRMVKGKNGRMHVGKASDFPKGMKLMNNPGRVRNDGLCGNKQRKRTSALESRLMRPARPHLGRGWDQPKVSRQDKYMEHAAKLGIKKPKPFPSRSRQSSNRNTFGMSGPPKLNFRSLDPNNTDFDSLKEAPRRFGGGGGDPSRKKQCVSALDRYPGGGPPPRVSTDENKWNAPCDPPKSKKPKSAFAAAFGKNIDRERLLKRGSKFKTEADHAKFDQQMGRVNAIVADEHRNEAKEQVTKFSKVCVFKCKHPGCPQGLKYYRKKNPICVRDGHQFKMKKADVYSFQCQKCGKKDQQIGRKQYKGACRKCGSTNVVAASFYRTAKAGKIHDEKLRTTTQSELGRWTGNGF